MPRYAGLGYSRFHYLLSHASSQTVSEVTLSLRLWNLLRLFFIKRLMTTAKQYRTITCLQFYVSSTDINKKATRVIVRKEVSEKNIYK